MTLAAPTYPLTEADALARLKRALGANYGGPVDDVTLTAELADDGLTVGAAFHPRPWATAARLIRFNTEYEVTDGLRAQINRKLRELDAQQGAADATARITHLLPRAAADDVPSGAAVPNVWSY